MSYWMYPTGEIIYNRSASAREIDAFLDQGDLPNGSEGPTKYMPYAEDGVVTISIDGYLRDRGSKADVESVRRWFKRIIKSAYVTRAHIEVKIGAAFVAGFYFVNGVFTEINAPDDFVDWQPN